MEVQGIMRDQDQRNPDATGATRPILGSGNAPAISRRTALRLTAAAGAAAGAAAVGGLGRGAARANQVTPGTPGTPVASPVASPGASPAATPDATGRIPSGMAGVPDAYLTYPEPFQSVDEAPGSGNGVATYQISYGPAVPPRDENRFWQELEARLNVSPLEVGLQPADTYPDKMAAIIAGGDLPELMVMTPSGYPEQYQYFAQGAFTDLGPYVTGDALQAYPNLARFPEYLWKNVAFNGTIYGIPRETFRIGYVLCTRLDWIDKLGLAVPQNAQEFHELMVAFSKGDPDGNGSADTYGLGSQGGDLGRPFFERMFRVPYGWRLNDDGTLTSAIETDEFVQAVEAMRNLWAAGGYHPDAPAMGSAQSKDALIGGRIGAFMDGPGGLPGSGGLRGRAAEVNPEANIGAIVPPGHDGGPGATGLDIGFWGMVSIPAAVGDEARVQELLRILNYYAAPFGSEESVFLGNGLEGIHHTVQPDGTRVATDQGQREIQNLTYLATAPTVFYYDRPGDAVFMQDMIKAHMAVGIENPTLTLYSPTSVERGAELGQLLEDTVNSVVTGREPLSALDEMENEWRNRGGDQIRQEYQDALDAS
jgi:putative aldouronate transport system substrate-binding protein